MPKLAERRFSPSTHDKGATTRRHPRWGLGGRPDRVQPDSIGALVDRRWSSTRRFALAGTLLAFPFLFIIDAWWDPTVSPVIPGLIALAVFWVGFPFVAMELWSRREADEEREERRHGASRYLLGAGAAWLLVWLVFLL